jgi:hypothetical protein
MGLLKQWHTAMPQNGRGSLKKKSKQADFLPIWEMGKHCAGEAKLGTVLTDPAFSSKVEELTHLALHAKNSPKTD